MNDLKLGRFVGGAESDIRASLPKFIDTPVDEIMLSTEPIERQPYETTVAEPFSVTGPGTYTGKASRTLTFSPTPHSGWWFDRTDQPRQLPIGVSARNVWTTIRSIVLRSGSPHNYMRMVEHIIALKLGMGLDNLVIGMDSGDPPLFDVGSMDLVEGVEAHGIVETDKPLAYWGVKEPVTIGGPHGSFLTILPPEDKSGRLYIDCAIDFDCAIGSQRIQFDLHPQSFRKGAHARTNCTSGMMLYMKTLGKLFADTRNLGYTRENIVIAGKTEYVNEAKLVHNDKSLEAVWHRSVLDLIAALGLIDTGRLCGSIYSYKAGHALDVELVTQLFMHDLLETV